MPHSKLVFIKLMLELADDTRFIMDLTDSQKLDYFLLLLSAGLTSNEIPINSGWFKARFCLRKDPKEIEQNLSHILKTFKKFKVYKGRGKFSNFKQLHNYIYKEKENLTGILKEFYKKEKSPKSIYYIISFLITYYINIKRYAVDEIDMQTKNRWGNRFKRLLILAKGDSEKVKGVINWVNKQGYIDWTLETCIKKYPDYLKAGKSKEIRAYKPPEKPDKRFEGSGK